MMGISKDKLKDICNNHGIQDEKLINALFEIITENNKALTKNMPTEVYSNVMKGLKKLGK